MKLRLAAVLSLVCAGVAVAEITRVTHDGWPDSLRIANGDAELVVVPAVGRIMRYAAAGEENLLWRHPAHAGHIGPLPDGGWPNVGGDKIWPWPDDVWPKALGDTLRDVDPPPEWDQGAHVAEITGPLSVRLTSPVWTAHGLRVVRDITLAESGARVTLAARIERVARIAAGTPIPVVPWTVTQLVLPDAVLVDFSTEPGSRPYGLHGRSWNSALRIDETTLWLPSPAGMAKLGANGRALGWWRGRVLFVQRLRKPAEFAGWKPHEQSQVFWTEVAGPGVTPYVELEFTGPALAANPETSATMVVEWELHRLSSPRPPMDEVVARFKASIDR